MNIKFSAFLLAALAFAAQAQLSSPIAGGLPAGTGPGVHSPNSPFAPLPDRADVVPWSVLTEVKTKAVKTRLLPAFPAAVQALSELPVEFAKDTTAACVAELVQGAGREVPRFLYVFVGTFVGGGLVLDGHIVNGPRGRIQGPLRAVLHNAELADKWQALGALLRYGGRQNIIHLNDVFVEVRHCAGAADVGRRGAPTPYSGHACRHNTPMTPPRILSSRRQRAPSLRPSGPTTPTTHAWPPSK